MIPHLVWLHQLDSAPEGVTRMEASVPRNLSIKDDFEPGPLELHPQSVQIVRQQRRVTPCIRRGALDPAGISSWPHSNQTAPPSDNESGFGTRACQEPPRRKNAPHPLRRSESVSARERCRTPPCPAC
jgi:hypothetical protein